MSDNGLMGWLGWLIPGLVAGVAARLLVPTGKRFGCLGTMLLGVVGSLVGGTLGSVLSGDGVDLSRGGFVGSIVGAGLVLVLLRWSSEG